MDESYTKKVLCKLNIDTVIEGYDITFEGCEPKLCTGYLDTGSDITDLVAIPIRELIKQGVSLHSEVLEWYEYGDVMYEGKPCKWFMADEVTILCH